MKLQPVAGMVVLVALAAGCATGPRSHLSWPPPKVHNEGTVAGTFVREGGPLGAGGTQPPNEPLSGTVRFTLASDGQSRNAATVHVGSSGQFRLSLPPGTYIVSGRTPSIVDALQSGVQKITPCSSPLSVTVRAGHTSHIMVTCIVP